MRILDGFKVVKVEGDVMTPVALEELASRQHKIIAFGAVVMPDPKTKIVKGERSP